MEDITYPEEILTTAERCIAEEHINDDISHLALSLAGRTDVRPQSILRQVEGHQRLRRKVPSWVNTAGIVFPQRLSLEQCSGEAAALYKCNIIRRLLPQATSMVDLTGGLGVDFSFLARLFKEATYVERQASLVSLAHHNMPLLGVNNARFIEAEAETLLAEMPQTDLIFLDPARRDVAGRKVVLLADCSPNIEKIMPLLLEKARIVLLKLSPMLDLQAALRSLPSIAEVHIVAEGSECKELLLVATASAPLQPNIICADGSRSFSFFPSEERNAVVSTAAEVGNFLYEPDTTIMKAGAFKLPAVRFALQKLHANSHLYTSADMVKAFPGRTFIVENVYDYSRNGIRRFIEDFRTLSGEPCLHANVAVRNFPMTAASLRDKLRLADGGSYYIFGTTIAPSRRVIIVCRKA